MLGDAGSFLLLISVDKYVFKQGNYKSEECPVVFPSKASRVLKDGPDEYTDINGLVISDYQPFSEAGPEQRAFPEKMTMDLVPGGTEAQQFRDLVFEFRIFPPYCKLYRTDIIHKTDTRNSSQSSQEPRIG